MIILRQKEYTGRRAAVRYANKMREKFLDEIISNKGGQSEKLNKLIDKIDKADNKVEDLKNKLINKKGKKPIVTDLYHKLENKYFKKKLNTKKCMGKYSRKLEDIFGYDHELDYITRGGILNPKSEEALKRKKYFEERYSPIMNKLQDNYYKARTDVNDKYNDIFSFGRKHGFLSNSEANNYNEKLIKENGLFNNHLFDKKKVAKAEYSLLNNFKNVENDMYSNNGKNWRKQVDYKINNTKKRGINFRINPYYNNANYTESEKRITMGGGYKNSPLTWLHEIGHSEGKILPHNNDILEQIKEETRADQNIIEGIKNNPNIHNNSKKQMLVSAEKYKELQPLKLYKELDIINNLRRK